MSYDDLAELAVVEQILNLKKDKHAVILAHNYQSPEIKFIADYIGDTLSISTLAKSVEQPVIVVCGPDFMVEITKILAPEKDVLYANEMARCPMAAMITLEELRTFKKAHPKAAVVGYVNTSVECKCEMDICCTSSNAVKIVKSLKAEEIIFVPDKNLGSYVKKLVPEKEIITWPGFCAVHQKILKQDILDLARAHPRAQILIHPECTPDVIEMADAVLSTDGMAKYGSSSEYREFIVATELEMVNAMAEDNPGKEFHAVEKAYCKTQKKVKLRNVLQALDTLEPKVRIPLDVLERAKQPLDKMLAAGRGD